MSASDRLCENRFVSCRGPIERAARQSKSVRFTAGSRHAVTSTCTAANKQRTNANGWAADCDGEGSIAT